MTLSKKTAEMNYCKWYFLVAVSLFTTAKSLSIPTPQYSVIVADDSQLENSESTNEYEMPEVSRRGYAAGEDFYRKISKSIPKIGRRSDLQASAWPWYKDRVPGLFKRSEINENCYYMPKIKNYIANNEICNDDLICCPIATDSAILKRYVSTNPPKQTTTISPDYKANRFIDSEWNLDIVDDSSDSADEGACAVYTFTNTLYLVKNRFNVQCANVGHIMPGAGN